MYIMLWYVQYRMVPNTKHPPILHTSATIHPTQIAMFTEENSYILCLCEITFSIARSFFLSLQLVTKLFNLMKISSTYTFICLEKVSLNMESFVITIESVLTIESFVIIAENVLLKTYCSLRCETRLRQETRPDIGKRWVLYHKFSV